MRGDAKGRLRFKEYSPRMGNSRAIGLAAREAMEKKRKNMDGLGEFILNRKSLQESTFFNKNLISINFTYKPGNELSREKGRAKDGGVSAPGKLLLSASFGQTRTLRSLPLMQRGIRSNKLFRSFLFVLIFPLCINVLHELDDAFIVGHLVIRVLGYGLSDSGLRMDD